MSNYLMETELMIILETQRGKERGEKEERA